MMKTNTLTLAVILLLFSCEAVEKQIVIDNPGDNPITVVFDDDAPITIEPHQTKEVVVRFGDRVVRVNDGPDVRISLNPRKNYLLNPLRESYYLKEARTSRAPQTKYDSPVTVIGNFQFQGGLYRSR